MTNPLKKVSKPLRTLIIIEGSQLRKFEMRYGAVISDCKDANFLGVTELEKKRLFGIN